MPQEIGLIGLGRIGHNLALNMIENDVSVKAWDHSSKACNKISSNSPRLKISTSIEELIDTLKYPRRVMLLVPSGDSSEQCIIKLSSFLRQGDLIIDSGNAHFRDTERRQGHLASQGIQFLGLGISGGVQGARHGPSIMAGGTISAWKKVSPILEAISARANGSPCAGYIGEGGAGHFIKIVHNGIEYAIMQILADVFELLSKGCGMPADKIAEIFYALNSGATASYLVEASAKISASKEEGGKLFLIDNVDDRAEQKGTGFWAVEAAFEMGVSIPTIAAAVQFRTISNEDRLIKIEKKSPPDGDSAPPFLPEEIVPLISPGIACAISSAYAQGFSLISAAKDNFGVIINRGRVAQIWRSGCILRGEMVNLIADSLHNECGHLNILSSSHLQPLVQEGIIPLRELVKAGLTVGLPLPGLGTAAGYIDSLNQSRLSTRFIQLQRDYFGDHGFRRIGQNAMEHGPWNQDDS